MFRHACKHFDPSRKLSEEDRLFIMEAGRQAPSSFGMEPWRFISIRNMDLKNHLRPVCWDQPQITECSDLIAILARTADPVTPSYYRSVFERRNLSSQATEAYIRRYTEYTKKLRSVSDWTVRQCYIAATHMMIYASMIGVDSCPIEGFERKKAEKILKIDRGKERLALFLPLGYRIHTPPPKKRRSFENVVSFYD
jgi:nitroreductase